MVEVGAPVPDALAQSIVLDRDSNESRLEDEFGEGATLVVFLRHFGCIGCAMQIGEVAPRLFELHRLGLRTVLVGNGGPRYIDGFVERHGLADKKVVLRTDPTLKIYEAAGFVRSGWATFGPQSIWAGLKARGRGLQNLKTEGDDFQQGGMMLLDGNRRVVYFHANENLGDLGDLNEVVDDAMRLLLASKATKLGAV